jgi:hypothetical protein
MTAKVMFDVILETQGEHVELKLYQSVLIVTDLSNRLYTKWLDEMERQKQGKLTKAEIQRKIRAISVESTAANQLDLQGLEQGGTIDLFVPARFRETRFLVWSDRVAFVYARVTF